MRGKILSFNSIVLESINYDIYTGVVQLILTCESLFNNVRTLNQRLELIKFQSCFWPLSCYLSKYCSGFSSSSSNIFYVLVFNVISAFTGNFCSKMIISTQSAQNHTTSLSESSSSALIFDTYGSCYN